MAESERIRRIRAAEEERARRGKISQYALAQSTACPRRQKALDALKRKKFRSLSNSAGWGKYGSENKSKKTARANLPKRLLKWVQGLDLNQ